MTDAVPYVLFGAFLVMLWRIRAKLLHGCDITLALARGLYHKNNIYLSDGFKCACAQCTIPFVLFLPTLSSA